MDDNYIVNRIIDILNNENKNLLIGNITSPRPGTICQVSTPYGIKPAFNINCTYPGNAYVVWDKDEKQYYTFTVNPSTIISSKQLSYRKNREITKPKVTSNIAVLFRVKDYTKSSSPVVLASEFSLASRLEYYLPNNYIVGGNKNDPFTVIFDPSRLDNPLQLIEEDLLYEGKYSPTSSGLPNSAGNPIDATVDPDTLDSLVIKDYVTFEGYSSPNFQNKVFEVTGISMVSSTTRESYPYTVPIPEPYQTIYAARYLIPELRQVGAGGSVKIYKSKWYVYYGNKLHLIKLNDKDYMNDSITDFHLTTLKDKALLNLWNRRTNTLYKIEITDKVTVTKYKSPQVIPIVENDWQNNWAYKYTPTTAGICYTKYKNRLATLHDGIINRLPIEDNASSNQILEYLKTIFNNFLKEDIELSYLNSKFTETTTCNLSNEVNKKIKLKSITNSFTEENEIEVLDVSIY